MTSWSVPLPFSSRSRAWLAAGLSIVCRLLSQVSYLFLRPHKWHRMAEAEAFEAQTWKPCRSQRLHPMTWPAYSGSFRIWALLWVPELLHSTLLSCVGDMRSSMRLLGWVSTFLEDIPTTYTDPRRYRTMRAIDIADVPVVVRRGSPRIGSAKTKHFYPHSQGVVCYRLIFVSCPECIDKRRLLLVRTRP